MLKIQRSVNLRSNIFIRWGPGGVHILATQGFAQLRITLRQYDTARIRVSRSLPRPRLGLLRPSGANGSGKLCQSSKVSDRKKKKFRDKKKFCRQKWESFFSFEKKITFDFFLRGACTFPDCYRDAAITDLSFTAVGFGPTFTLELTFFYYKSVTV